ncbi:hypothetical protein Tco_0888368 [Tanacetum coccineum]
MLLPSKYGGDVFKNGRALYMESSDDCGSGGGEGGGVLGVLENSKENQSGEEDKGILVILHAFGPTNWSFVRENGSWVFLHCHVGSRDTIGIKFVSKAILQKSTTLRT